MSKYQIQRWDPALIDKNTSPIPMIYIKPDDTFLKFAKNNASAMLVKIEGTGTIYDGKEVIGIAAESAYSPNLRVNFYNATKLWVIKLAAPWKGYPDSNGFVMFQGVNGVLESDIVSDFTRESQKEEEKDLSIECEQKKGNMKPLVVEEYEQKAEKKCNRNFSNRQLSYILIGTVVIFGVLFLMSKDKKRD